MNRYRLVIKAATGDTLSEADVLARSLDVAATEMRTALRRTKDAMRSELWLGNRRVSVIVRRSRKLVMVQDTPSPLSTRA